MDVGKECKSWRIILSNIPAWVFFDRFLDACSNFFEPFMSSREYDGAIYNFLKQYYLFSYIGLNDICNTLFLFWCEEFILSHLSQIGICHIYARFIIFISSTHEWLMFLIIALLIQRIIVRIIQSS